MTQSKPCKRPKDGPQFLGWCMTGNHDQCRVEYTDWNGKQRRCPCVNHEEKK